MLLLYQSQTFPLAARSKYVPLLCGKVSPQIPIKSFSSQLKPMSSGSWFPYAGQETVCIYPIGSIVQWAAAHCPLCVNEWLLQCGGGWWECGENTVGLAQYPLVRMGRQRLGGPRELLPCCMLLRLSEFLYMEQRFPSKLYINEAIPRLKGAVG